MSGQYSRDLSLSSQDAMQQVYAPGFKAVLTIPAKAIRHLPPASLNVTRLVLCANYDPRNPEGSCPMGARCKFVHADATCAPQHEIHVNYAWRSLDEVAYDRFPAGEILHVAPPNSKATGDVMDSQLALKTKALASHRRPLSHCAHYYFNRTCNLGPECRFIHAVFIDPKAKEHQRAPAPAQLGREHHHHQYRQQRAAGNPMGMEHAMFAADPSLPLCASQWSPSDVPTPLRPGFISLEDTHTPQPLLDNPCDARMHSPPLHELAALTASG